jgi:hypothetical protein
MFSRNIRYTVGFGIFVMAAGACFSWGTRVPQPARAPSVRAKLFDAPTSSELRRLRKHAERPNTPEVKLEPRKAELIGAVLLESEEICLGEELLVLLEPKDRSIPLSVRINGARSNPAVLRTSKLGEHKIRVEAYSRRLQIQDARDAEFRVVDCGERPQLVISAREGQMPKEVEARVRVTKDLGENVLYTYDFGDGTVVETAAPSLRHVYQADASEVRPTFIVHVFARSADSGEADGRAHYTFVNDADAGMTIADRQETFRANMADRESRMATLRSELYLGQPAAK